MDNLFSNEALHLISPESGDVFEKSPDEFSKWILERERHPGRQLFTLVAEKLFEAVQRTHASQYPPSGQADKEIVNEQLYKSGEGKTTIYLMPPDSSDFDLMTNRPSTNREGVLIEIPTEFKGILDNWQYKKREPEFDGSDDGGIFGELTGEQYLEDELLMEQMISRVEFVFFGRNGQERSLKIVTSDVLEMHYTDDEIPYIIPFAEDSRLPEDERELENENVIISLGDYARRVLEITIKIQTWVPGSFNTVRYGVKDIQLDEKTEEN